MRVVALSKKRKKENEKIIMMNGHDAPFRHDDDDALNLSGRGASV